MEGLKTSKMVAFAGAALALALFAGCSGQDAAQKAQAAATQAASSAQAAEAAAKGTDAEVLPLLSPARQDIVGRVDAAQPPCPALERRDRAQRPVRPPLEHVRHVQPERLDARQHQQQEHPDQDPGGRGHQNFSGLSSAYSR